SLPSSCCASSSSDLPALHSFPTRRSSDLFGALFRCWPCDTLRRLCRHPDWLVPDRFQPGRDALSPVSPRRKPMPLMESNDRVRQDRKSTRLNSSHVKISYAVFCLKKKKKQ